MDSRRRVLQEVRDAEDRAEQAEARMTRSLQGVNTSSGEDAASFGVAAPMRQRRSEVQRKEHVMCVLRGCRKRRGEGRRYPAIAVGGLMACPDERWPGHAHTHQQGKDRPRSRSPSLAGGVWEGLYYYQVCVSSVSPPPTPSPKRLS